MTTLKMTVEEWIKVQDNPRQRDTERHALKAKHLYEPQPTHAFVAAAKLPNGTLIKLDGHTRAYMWKRKLVTPPKAVEVNVVAVSSVEGAAELYTHYDSKYALETAVDQVSGGFREIGFAPKSTLLRTGRIGTALRVAYVVVKGHSAAKKVSPYEMINEFAAEILALDDLELPQGSASSAIQAAFFLTYRKHGDSCLPFWRAVFSNAGVKQGEAMDGVQALHELILERRGRNAGSAWINDVCARACWALEKYLIGDMLHIPPRPVDLATYLTKRPALKRVA